MRIFCDRAKLVCVEGPPVEAHEEGPNAGREGHVGKLNRLLFDAAYSEHEPRLFRRLSLGSLAGACPSPRTTGKSPTISFACARLVIGVLEAERDESGAISRRAYSEFLHGSICSKRSALRMKIGPSWNVADIENPRHSMRSSISL